METNRAEGVQLIGGVKVVGPWSEPYAGGGF